VVAARYAVTVAQRQLEDTQDVQDEERRNDLSRISYDVTKEGKKLVITITVVLIVSYDT
jgi:hypothetical protein